jgi:hypothetical protein
MRRLIPLLIAPALALVALLPAQAGDEVLELGSRRELFADRTLVGKITGDVRLKLHEPKPQEVVLVTGEPWEGNTSAYFTLFQDGDRYRMYYRGSHFDEAAKKSAHPRVDLLRREQGRRSLDEAEARPVRVRRLEREQHRLGRTWGRTASRPSRTTTPTVRPMRSTRRSARGSPKGLYVFQSPDGIHWKLMQETPVITTGRSTRRTWRSGTRTSKSTSSTTGLPRRRAGHPDLPSPTTSSTGPSRSTSAIPTAPKEHLYTNAVRLTSAPPHFSSAFPPAFSRKHSRSSRSS